MGFFAEFSQWLNALLATFIASKTAALAAALEPALTILATLYVSGWGYLQLTGQIEEPLMAGFARIARIAVVLAVGIRLWLYHAVIVDIGAPDTVTTVDTVIFQGCDAAAALIQKGGIFDGDFSYYLAGFFVYIAVGIAAIYTVFLLSLAKVALSILLALGPLFIAAWLFDASRRFFDAWLAQLANYALIGVLTSLVVALLMQLLTQTATQAATLGTGIDIATGIRLCFACGLIFLVLRQVMPMASGLASGVALSTHHAFSHSANWIGRQIANPRLRTVH